MSRAAGRRNRSSDRGLGEDRIRGRMGRKALGPINFIRSQLPPFGTPAFEIVQLPPFGTPAFELVQFPPFGTPAFELVQLPALSTTAI